MTSAQLSVLAAAVAEVSPGRPVRDTLALHDPVEAVAVVDRVRDLLAGVGALAEEMRARLAAGR